MRKKFKQSNERPKEVNSSAKVFVNKGTVVGYKKEHEFAGKISARITVYSGETSSETEATVIEPELLAKQDVIGKKLSLFKKETKS